MRVSGETLCCVGALAVGPVDRPALRAGLGFEKPARDLLVTLDQLGRLGAAHMAVDVDREPFAAGVHRPRKPARDRRPLRQTFEQHFLLLSSSSSEDGLPHRSRPVLSYRPRPVSISNMGPGFPPERRVASVAGFGKARATAASSRAPHQLCAAGISMLRSRAALPPRMARRSGSSSPLALSTKPSGSTSPISAG